jgi:hypothetical protein
MQNWAFEFRRIHLPRTPVNRPFPTLATHSSQLVATKIIRLRDALGAYGCYLLQGSGKEG